MPQRLDIRPMPAEDPWTAAMRRGDFDAAWRISDRILQERRGLTCWHWPRHEQFVWTGELLAGKRVLVRCYHGLGDTIQFIRLAAPLRRIAREVVVWAQPALMPLVAGAPGVDRVLPLHDGVPEVDYDADVEIMELAHALRVTPDDLAGHVPYLSPPQPAPCVAADATALRVGIVWEAGGWDRRRSLPASFVRDLAAVQGIRLCSLQVGPARCEAEALGLPDLAHDDVAQAAARMRALDLIISVDTMAAHLAGALGVPVWTLLHADCDWRWMRDRSDSPWYPTMRLVRQRVPGDWPSVVKEMRAALAELAAPRGKKMKKKILKQP
jgi:hypothetical protein